MSKINAYTQSKLYQYTAHYPVITHGGNGAERGAQKIDRWSKNWISKIFLGDGENKPSTP